LDSHSVPPEFQLILSVTIEIMMRIIENDWLCLFAKLSWSGRRRSAGGQHNAVWTLIVPASGWHL